MKKLILALLFLLLSCSVSFAWMGPVIISGQATCSPSYDISENFDGSNSCYSGDSGNNCDLTWTVAGTYNFQATALEGSYSLELDETGGEGSAYHSITSSSAAYVHMLFSIDTLPAGAKIITALTATSSIKVYVQLQTNGTLKIYNGLATAVTIDAISAGTTYHIWYGGTKGTGSDASAYVAFSSDSTKPTSGNNKYAGFDTGGTNTSNLTRLYLGYGNTGHKPKYDHVGVSLTDICSPTP